MIDIDQSILEKYPNQEAREIGLSVNWVIFHITSESHPINQSHCLCHFLKVSSRYQCLFLGLDYLTYITPIVIMVFELTKSKGQKS